MLHPILALFLCLPLVLQDPPKEQKPDAAAVKAAVTQLDEAFTKGKSPERIAAIQAAASLADAEIVKRIAKGLSDSDQQVQMAAVEALRFMGHPEALKALEEGWKRNRKDIKDDTALAAAYLQAIGQYGSPSSIDLLADKPFDTKNYPCIRARLMGLANIRKNESVEKIIGMLNMVGTWKSDDYMDDVRIALYRLTGVDNGKDPLQWQNWWRDNKKSFQVSKEAAPMGKVAQYTWDSYWSKTPIEKPKEDGTGGKQ
jgi:uncharacterized protein